MPNNIRSSFEIIEVIAFGLPLLKIRIPPLPARIAFLPFLPAVWQRWKRPALPAQHLLGVVTAHFAEEEPQAAIAKVVLEAGLDLPCLIKQPWLIEGPHLSVRAAE